VRSALTSSWQSVRAAGRDLWRTRVVTLWNKMLTTLSTTVLSTGSIFCFIMLSTIRDCNKEQEKSSAIHAGTPSASEYTVNYVYFPR
jgi:hypothetical protein